MFELYESIAITFPGCVDSFNATSFNATCTGNPSLELIGSGWQNHTTNALFAIDLLACLVLLACLGLATRFKWTIGHGLDHVKSIGYVIATGAMLLDFMTVLVNTGLAETGTTISNHYSVLYIFNSLGWRVGEVMILAIVLSIIHHRFHVDRHATKNFHPLVSPAIIISVVLIALLSAAAWAIFVAYIARIINNTFYFGTLISRWVDVNLAYDALYLLVTLFALVPAAVLFLREHSLTSILLLVIIVPSLILRTLMDLVAEVISYFNTSATVTTINNFDWAASFVYCFTTMAIFVGVAIVALQKPDHGMLRKNLKDGAA